MSAARADEPESREWHYEDIPAYSALYAAHNLADGLTAPALYELGGMMIVV